MWRIEGGREVYDPAGAVRRVMPEARRLPPEPERPRLTLEQPSLPDPPDPPDLLAILPWMAMVAMYSLASWAAFGFRSAWMLLLAPMGFLATYAGMVLSHRQALRRHRREVTRRQAQFRARLQRLEQMVLAYWNARMAREALLYPAWPDLVRRLRTGTGLWFRQPGDPDYLTVRAGTRLEALPGPEGPAPEEGPEELRAMLAEIRSVVESPRSVPLAAPAGGAAWRMAAGTEGVVRRMLLELAMTHSPEGLRIYAALSDPGWSFLRWLPHVGEEREGWADGPGAVRERVLEEFYRRQAGASGPDLLVLLDASALEDPRIPRLAREGPSVGVHPLLLLPPWAPAPPGLRAEVWLLPDLVRVTAASVVEGVPDPPALDPAEAEALAQGLQALRPPGGAPRTDRSVAALWPPSPPRPPAGDGLAVPVGWEDDGRPVELDLHERGDGPHAMVIGATGSGKSEALRTLALALAYHFPPERVQLLFIDFKGGGAFAPLEGLPHCVGLLSNLDAREAARAMETLEGELDRRQRILAERGADHADQIGLPHLVVMVDEFAEMLEAIPDGMARMIRLARLGRSLGMHLVLATQRLGSAVPADLRANLRVRIALRCETPDESAAVIGRPDAAYLPGPGWAFLQVGQNERFRRLRFAYLSGRSGGGRRWMDPADPDRRLRTEGGPADAPRELDRLAARIRETDRPAPRLAPPPMPEDPGLPAGEEAGRIGVGVADFPEEGEIRWVWCDDRVGDLHLTGQAGTGKTRALQAAAAAAAARGRRVWVLDLSGEWAGIPWAARVGAGDAEGWARLRRALAEAEGGLLVVDGRDAVEDPAGLEALEALLGEAAARPGMWIWTAGRRMSLPRPLRGRPFHLVLLSMPAEEWRIHAPRSPLPEAPFRGIWMDGERARSFALRRAFPPSPPPPAPPLPRMPARVDPADLPPPRAEGEGWRLFLGLSDEDLRPDGPRLIPRRPQLALELPPEQAEPLLAFLAARLEAAGFRILRWDPEETLAAGEAFPTPEAALEAAASANPPWALLVPNGEAWAGAWGWRRDPPAGLRRPAGGLLLVAGPPLAPWPAVRLRPAPDPGAPAPRPLSQGPLCFLEGGREAGRWIRLPDL